MPRNRYHEIFSCYHKSLSAFDPVEIAVLGGGCFWCLDAVYRRISGIDNVASGYTGGNLENPSYEDICRGNTGHAEVVKTEYNPEKISFENILEVFWNIHDPTALNRQGNDTGTQYRSVIFYLNEDQKVRAEKSRQEAEAAGLYANPFVTEIQPLGKFYEAEKYHQNYYDMNRMANPYCMAVIDPKVKKFIQHFPDYLKDGFGGY